VDPALQTARYVNLTTFRKDGREVATPVWFAALEGKLYAYTLRDAGKLKRIRANGRVRVAPCDVRGRIHGKWSDGTGRIVTDAALIARAYGAFPDKYGWLYRLSSILSKLSGKYPRRVMMELSV
jgi:hypothetical protein